jgi:cytochrome c
MVAALAPVALAALALAASSPDAAAAGTPTDHSARGRILFLRCASCHDATPAPSAKIGPDLYGVVGRKAASLPGFAYSAALKSQDFVWDADHLDRWIENPNAVAPGTIMAFAGIAAAADRQAIIEYLQNQGGGAGAGAAPTTAAPNGSAAAGAGAAP